MQKPFAIITSLIISILPTISTAAANFSGTYIGINGGPAWASSNYQTNPNCPPTTFAVFCDSQAESGINGNAVSSSGSGQMNLTRSNFAAHVGHNWLIRNLVVGGEAEFGSLNLNKNIATNGIFPVAFLGNAYSLNNSISTSWLGLLRLRAGTVVKEHFLIYLAGGVAFTNFRLMSAYQDNAIGFGFPGGSGSNARSNTSSGWTLGAGGEWQFTDRYSVDLEYLYLKFKSINLNVPLSNTPEYTQVMQVSANLRTQIARIGFNFRF